MNLRQGLVLLLAVVIILALVAARILWAFTLWYEWIALAVCGACLLAMSLLSTDKPRADSPLPPNDSNG